MSIRTRLDRLEKQDAGSGETAKLRTMLDWSDEQWLACFEKRAAEGHFDGEPDAPEALAAYRTAIREARQIEGDPEPGWCPHLSPEQRRLEWQSYRHRPVVEALGWLANMHRRVIDGRPPITEAERLDLIDWFEAHQARIFAGRDRVDLGNGRQVFSGSSWRLQGGPGHHDTNDAVEDFRRLRQVVDRL